MSEPTLVLSPRYHADSNDMMKAAQNRGWSTHRAIRYVGPEDGSNCCVYGELLFADIMASRLKLGLLDPPDFWLAKLPADLLKRTVRGCRPYTLSYCFDKIGEKAFVKPANDKVFQYGVYERSEDVPLRFVDPHCPILLSEVVSFDIEVRCYVLDREVIAWEYYRLIGDHTEEEARTDGKLFAESVLKRVGYQLPSAVVLDVGHIEGRGWAVVEANQAYSSGIYGEADRDSILDVIYRAAGPVTNVSKHDLPFVRTPFVVE